MSTTAIATIILVGVFLTLVFLRVPIVFAIGIASLIDFFYLGINPVQMALKFVGNLNSYTLLAVPFFILMGELMSAGGITDTLISFPKSWLAGSAAARQWSTLSHRSSSAVFPALPPRTVPLSAPLRSR